MQLALFHQRVQANIKQLLTQQVEQLPAQQSQLKAAMSYALLNGGKRTRPLLAYTVGQMLDVKSSDLDSIAMAIEAIHCYSLIHDDLPAMDDDELRRGQPTCHIKFDEATAILAGDALQSLAFEILADYPLSDDANGKRVELIKYLSQAAGYRGMCGGQALDIAATGQSISQALLEDLHNRKTGALLAASIIMPSLIATDITTETMAQLTIFADNIGLAFQVQDDILDVTSDSLTLGKPQGSDIDLDKSTYPALLGLEGARNYLAKLHKQALQALDALPYNTDLLVEFSDYMIKRTF